ncbi:MAG: EF-hand domain-containing protein [Planctomycetota bacterium]|mgnify:CR=1 FL=1
MRWLTTPALTLALALAAYAGDGPSPVDDFFTRWDANKDGLVTKDECESSRLFSKNDKDADGSITRTEVEAVWKEEEGSEALTEPKNPGTDPRLGSGGKGKGGGLPGVKMDGKQRPGSTGMDDEMNKMRVRRIFNKFDKNGDESLSSDEAAAYYFEVLDTDRDGSLMEYELSANPKVGGEKAAMAMQYYDKDGDGMIAATEWSMPEDGTFTKVDTNGDGKIAFDEALIGFTLPGRGGDTTAQKEGARGQLDVETFMKDNDADGDGKISAGEFKGPKQLFGKADANADGFVDRAELDAASKKLQKMAGGGGGGKPAVGNVAEMVKRADKDGDGKVTREEWPGRPQMFDRMDKNGDGVLDDADFGGAPAKQPEAGTMEGEGSSPEAAAPSPAEGT